MARLQAQRATPVHRTLPNGVRLLAIHMPHVQSASVGRVPAGGLAPRDAPASSAGISHVLEHMAFKGTHARSVQAINLDAERLGADVNAYTSKDTTGYFMTGLARHAQQFLEMTADIVLNSTFPDNELQRELEVIRQQSIEYEEDPEEGSSELLDRAIWGDDPMGMPVIGTVGNIEGFTRRRPGPPRAVPTTSPARPWSPRPATSTSTPGSRSPGSLLQRWPPSAESAGVATAGAREVRRPCHGPALQPGVAGVPEHCLPAGARAGRRRHVAAALNRKLRRL